MTASDPSRSAAIHSGEMIAGMVVPAGARIATVGWYDHRVGGAWVRLLVGELYDKIGRLNTFR